jgi:hypothetical protein
MPVVGISRRAGPVRGASRAPLPPTSRSLTYSPRCNGGRRSRTSGHRSGGPIICIASRSFTTATCWSRRRENCSSRTRSRTSVEISRSMPIRARTARFPRCRRRTGR